MSEYTKKDKMGRKHFKEDLGKYFIIEQTSDDYNKVDLYLTARTDTGKTYCVEVKNYEDPKHPRPYSKFITVDGIDKGYQIDLDKLEHLFDTAEREGRTPIVYARFSDITLVWDISKIDFESRARWVKTNKDGQNYGEKEYSWQSYLYKYEAAWKKETQLT